MTDIKKILKYLNTGSLGTLQLERGNLKGVILPKANLMNANLKYSDLYEANLSHADLSFADLSYATLTYAFRYASSHMFMSLNITLRTWKKSQGIIYVLLTPRCRRQCLRLTGVCSVHITMLCQETGGEFQNALNA